MSHPARLSLRAPPHLPFIQGYPGIPPLEGGKRVAAGVSGTVEVRVGAQAVKAKWVRVEIRRHEQLPPGFPSAEPTWEHVGEINTLWRCPQGKEFDQLDTSDFRFFLPLPETTPPSVEMMKGSGVRYELVAALCYKKKGGIFKSDSAEIIKISEPLTITKHELHSAWPVYNNPDSKAVTAQEVNMTVQRPGVAFGPGDRILLTASIRSSRGIPFKLRGFECTLMEVVTMYALPAKDKKKKTQAGPVVKSRPIAQARCAVDESVGRGGEKSARIDMAVPADNLLVTVRHAKTLEVGYELQVKAVCDGFEGPTVSAIRYVVGLYSKNAAQQAIREIGHVPSLCPFTSPPASRATSNTGSAPRPQSFAAPTAQQTTPNGLAPFAQGDWRRQSTSTITTTTDRNHAAAPANDWLPLPNGRPFSTLPARHLSPAPYGQQQQQQSQQVQGNVPFPTASPAPTDKLYRSNSATMSDYSTTAPDDRSMSVSMAPTSDQGHTAASNHRQSGMTMATFGAWDKGLQRNLQGVEESVTDSSSPTSASTRTIPNPYLNPAPFSPTPSSLAPGFGPSSNAESEKVRLYDAARQNAAASHRSTGVPLAMVGLDDIPDTAPPEYAPPVPALPAAVQEERSLNSRPGSMLVATPPMASPPAMGRDTVPFGTGMAGMSGVGINGYSNSSPVPGGLPSGASGSGSASGPARVATPSSAVPPLSAAGLSDATSKPTALSEKEQMRRYFEAKDKVERAARGEVETSDNSEEEEGNQAGPSGAAASAESSVGAIDGDIGAGSAAGIAPTIPLSQTHPTASSSSSAYSPTPSQQQQQPQGTSGALGAAGGQYLSPEQEKDMMRQRYEEATLRANRARSSLGHQAQEFGQNGGMASPVQPALVASPTSESPSAKSHIPFASASQTPVGGASSSRPSFEPGPSQFLSSQGGQSPLEKGGSGSGRGDAGSGFMTAEQEKDMMRRRFEDAQARVDKAYGRPRPSDGAPPLSEPGRDASGSRAANGDSTQGTGNSNDMSPPALATPQAPSPLPVGPSSTSHTASNAQQYPTAEQEKEEMRRRFEQATSRVVSGGGGIPGGTSAGGAGASKPLPPARPMSMQPPSREGSTAPPVLNGIAQSSLQGLAEPGRSGTSANGAATSSVPTPPPPLPARPPAEYINLLSPSEAPNKRYSFA